MRKLELRPEAFASLASRFFTSGLSRMLRVALLVFAMNTYYTIKFKKFHYPSFSPSSEIPIFDSRYRSAFRDSPNSRAAWLLFPFARRSAS